MSACKATCVAVSACSLCLLMPAQAYSQAEVSAPASHQFAELSVVIPPADTIPAQLPEGDAALTRDLLKSFNLSNEIARRGLEVFRAGYGRTVRISGTAFEMSVSTLLDDLGNLGYIQMQLLEPEYARLWIHVPAQERENKSGLTADELKKRLALGTPVLESRLEGLRQTALLLNSLERKRGALDADARRLTESLMDMRAALSPLRKPELLDAQEYTFSTRELAEFVYWYGRSWMFVFQPGDDGLNDTEAIARRVAALTPLVRQRIADLVAP